MTFAQLDWSVQLTLWETFLIVVQKAGEGMKLGASALLRIETLSVQYPTVPFRLPVSPISGVVGVSRKRWKCDTCASKSLFVSLFKEIRMCE